MKEINEMEPNLPDLMLNIRVSNDVTTVNKMVKIASTTTDTQQKDISSQYQFMHKVATHNIEIYKHVRALFDLDNPNLKPISEKWPTSVQRQ